MIPKWTSAAVGKMHLYGLNNSDIADKMGVTKGYISMLLNGKKTPSMAEERVLNAIEQIIKEHAKEG